MKLPLAEVESLVARGESDTLEFKRTTGELKAARCVMMRYLSSAWNATASSSSVK